MNTAIMVPVAPRTPPYLWVALLLILVAGGLGWRSLSRTSITTVAGPSAAIPPITNAITLYVPTPEPTPRPTLVPPTPSETPAWWEAYPSCATLSPGAICQPEVINLVTPAPMATCSADPADNGEWLHVCVQPTAANAGTEAGDGDANDGV